jgi:hypothetical protein
LQHNGSTINLADDQVLEGVLEVINPQASTVIVSALMFLLLPRPLAGQSNQKALTDAVLKTLRFTDQIKSSYDLEIVMSSNLTDSLTRQDKDYCMHSETITRIREISDIESGDFVISQTTGRTSLKILNGRDSLRESNEMSIRHGKNGNDRLTFIPLDSPAIASERPCWENGGCIAAGREFDLGRMVLTFRDFNNPGERETELDRVLVMIMEADESDISVVQVRRPGSNKLVKEYRFKKIVQVRQSSEGSLANVGLGYCFTISNEGLDDGLVISVSNGLMLPSKTDEKYNSQSQIKKDVEMSVSVEWRKYSMQKYEIILPTSMVQKLKTSKSSSQTIDWTFDWKSFERPDKKELSLEAAESRCREARKLIDKALLR